MNLSNLSPDIIAIAVLAACGVYGMLLGAGGVRILILGAAAGNVAAMTFGSMAQPFLPSPQGLAQGAIFASVIVLFALTQHRPNRHGSAMLAAVAGVVAGVLVVTLGLDALPIATQASLVGGSFLLTEAQAFQPLILGVSLAVGILIPLFYKPHRSHH